MKDIKLVAIDVDGTLLNSEHEITDETIAEINRLLDQGVHIAACTGRPIHTIPEFLREHPALEYLIGANGAVIYDNKRKKNIKEYFLTDQQALEVVDKAKDYSYAITVLANGELYSNKSALATIEKMKNEKFKEFFANSRLLVDDLIEIIKTYSQILEKIGLNFENQDVKKQAEKILKSIEGLHVTSSLEHNIEVSHERAQKGLAVDELRKMLGLSTDQIVTIGDNFNDVSMLTLTKNSFAMGNAPEEVKKVAQYVTDTNDNNGVAKVLRKIVI